MHRGLIKFAISQTTEEKREREIKKVINQRASKA